MNYLFIIFILGLNMGNSFFYPKIKICKILNCNKDYGTEYDLEMDIEEYLFHSLNFNYLNTNNTNTSNITSSNNNIILHK